MSKSADLSDYRILIQRTKQEYEAATEKSTYGKKYFHGWIYFQF